MFELKIELFFLVFEKTDTMESFISNPLIPPTSSLKQFVTRTFPSLLYAFGIYNHCRYGSISCTNCTMLTAERMWPFFFRYFIPSGDAVCRELSDLCTPWHHQASNYKYAASLTSFSSLTTVSIFSFWGFFTLL